MLVAWEMEPVAVVVDVQNRLRAAAQAECRTIALPLAGAGELGPTSPLTSWTQLAREAGDLGIRIAAILPQPHAASDCISATGATRSELLERINRQMERARTLPASLLVVPLAALIEANAAARPDDALRGILDTLRTARFIGERHGIRVTMDVGAGGLIASPFELRDLIDQANSYWVAGAIDLARRPGGLAAADWGRLLGHRLAAIRSREPAHPDVDATIGALGGQRWDGILLVPTADACRECTARHSSRQ